MVSVGLLENIIREAMREAECVALFTICLILLLLMHVSNLHKLDNIRRKLNDSNSSRNED